MSATMFISKYADSHTASIKLIKEWTQQEHTAKCDRTGHNRNILQSATGLDTTGTNCKSATGLDTTGTNCKVRQDWTQQEHTAKCDRTGHNRNILQSATGLDTTGTYFKVRQD